MQTPLIAQPDAPAEPEPSEQPPAPDVPSAQTASGAHVTGLLMSISFMDAIEYGVIMPSLYQYIKQVSSGMPDSVIQQNYGIVLASFSFASMCCKPWLGAWCDMRSFKEVFTVTFSIAIAGNVIYAVAGLLGSWHYMLVGRLLSGVGAANSALGPAYIARTVDPSQRTSHLTKLSLAFPLGLVAGPATNLITGAINFSIGDWKVDESNSAGLLLALLLFFQLIAVLLVLREPPAYSLEARRSARQRGWWCSVLSALCQVSVAACFVTIFTFNFLIGTSEALVVPITTHAYGFTPLQNSLVYMGIAIIMILGNILVLRFSAHPLAPLAKLGKQLRDVGMTDHASKLATLATDFKLAHRDAGTVAEWTASVLALADTIASQEAVCQNSSGRNEIASALNTFAKHPPRRTQPLFGDRTMVLSSCVFYLVSAAYTLVFFTWDMPLWRYLVGQTLLLATVPFVFAPNRAYFSRQIENSVHQALLNSLMSVLASLGGVLGPVWLGVSIGEPEDGKPVAQLTFLGCGVLVLINMVVFAASTTTCTSPPAR